MKRRIPFRIVLIISVTLAGVGCQRSTQTEVAALVSEAQVGGIPAFRVDQHDAIESVNADVLRLERTLRDKIIPRHWEPGHLAWRAQVPSGSGEWEDTPPLLIGQLVEGERLLVRVYLSGGYQKDIIFPLAGFCAAAAQVYAQGAPALECPA